MSTKTKKVIDVAAFLVMVLAIADIVITIAKGSWEAIWAVARVKYNITEVRMKYEFSLFQPLLIMLLAGSLPSLKSYVERLRVRYIGMWVMIFMFFITSLQLIDIRGGKVFFLTVFYIIFTIVFIPFLLPKWHPYELMLLGVLSTVLALYILNLNFYYSSMYVSILFLGLISFTAGYIVLKGTSPRLESLIKIEVVLLAIAMAYRFYVTGDIL